MNRHEAEEALAACKQLETISVSSIMDNFANQDVSLEDTGLVDRNMEDFQLLYQNVVSSFVDSFNDKLIYLSLPTLNITIDGKSGQIIETLKKLYNYLIKSSLNEADRSLTWLVSYQVRYGIYNRNSLPYSEKRSRELYLKLNLESHKLNERMDLLKNTTEEYIQIRKELDSYILQKHGELNIISSNVESTNKLREQATSTFTDVSVLASNIKRDYDTSKNEMDSFKKTASEFEERVNETNKLVQIISNKATDELRKIEEDTTTYNKLISEIDDKKAIFDERLNYLENLIGKEVGNNLFQTFKQRKDELKSSVRFWQWAVPVMAIVTVGWIFFIFSNKIDFQDDVSRWELLAINFIKSIPAVFILIFTINQYRKERNFQEEYAFKSAVALTIDAYAKMVIDPINKDRLITEAVLNIFKTPIEDRFDGHIKSKTALDTVKSMADTTKELLKKEK